MKIKCIKLQCLVCGNSGSCQLFMNRLGQIRYARVRHYNHIDKVSRKPQFTYHKLEDLPAYYDFQLNVLMHFRYPEEFLRRTKNCYISFIPDNVVKEIESSQPVSYYAIRKRLNRNGVKLGINELRDHFGTNLRKYGITKEEIDLLQGRIPQEIFIRQYWSPRLSELRDRIFNKKTIKVDNREGDFLLCRQKRIKNLQEN